MSNLDKKIGVHQSGMPVVYDPILPKGPDGKPVKFFLDQISFYEPPSEVEAGQKLDLSLIQQPIFQRRLKVQLELAKAHKAFALLEKLNQNSSNISAEELNKTRDLLGRQIDPKKLEEVLFIYFQDLLAPQGHPVDEKRYVQTIQSLLEIFRGKSEKPYITVEQIKKIYNRQSMQGVIEPVDLYREIALEIAQNVPMGTSVMSLDSTALPKIQNWLMKTEVEGIKNSILFERMQFQEIHKALKKADRATFHCKNLLNQSAEIEKLLNTDKLVEAKKIFLSEYLRGRGEVLNLNAELEQVKKFKHYTLGVAIVVAAGFAAYFTAGAAVPLLTRGVASPFLKFGTHVVVNGTTFVATEKILNRALLNEDIFDPAKTGWENGRDFTLKSIFMGLLGPFLGQVVKYSRMHSLVPDLIRHGKLTDRIPSSVLEGLDKKAAEVVKQSFFKGGVFDLTSSVAKEYLPKIIEAEIMGMSKLAKTLFLGREFVEEVGAFVGWELLESQVTLLAEGKKPSLKNLEVIDKILSGEAMVDRVLFLGALKTGNRIARPITEPASKWLESKVKEWDKKRVEEFLSENFQVPETPTALTRLSFWGLSLGAFFSSGAASKTSDPIAGLITLAGIGILGSIWGSNGVSKKPAFQDSYDKSFIGLANDLIHSFETVYKEVEQLKKDQNSPLAVAYRAFESIDVLQFTEKVGALLTQAYQSGHLSHRENVRAIEFNNVIESLRQTAPLLFSLVSKVKTDPRIMAIAKKPDLAKAIIQIEVYLQALKNLSFEEVPQLEALLRVITKPMNRLDYIKPIKQYLREKISNAIKEFLLVEEVDALEKPVEDLIKRLGPEYAFIRDAKLGFEDLIESVEIGAEDFSAGSYFGGGGGIIRSILVGGFGLGTWLSSGIADAAQSGWKSVAGTPTGGMILLTSALLFGVLTGKKKLSRKIPVIDGRNKDQELLVQKSVQHEKDLVVIERLYKTALKSKRAAVSKAVEHLARFVPEHSEAFEKIVKICYQKDFVIPVLSSLLFQKNYEPAYHAIVQLAFKTTYKAPVTLLFDFAASGADRADSALATLVEVAAHHLKRKQRINKDHAERILEEIYRLALHYEDPYGPDFYGALKKLAKEHPSAVKWVKKLEEGEKSISFEPEFGNLENSSQKNVSKVKQFIRPPSADVPHQANNPEVTKSAKEAAKKLGTFVTAPWRVDSKAPRFRNKVQFAAFAEDLGEINVFTERPEGEREDLVKPVKVVQVKASKAELKVQTLAGDILRVFFKKNDLPPTSPGKFLYIFIPDTANFRDKSIKRIAPLASLIILLDQVFSSSPALASVKAAFNSVSPDMTGLLTALGLSMATAVITTKAKSETAETPQKTKSKGTVRPFPLQLKDYEITKQDKNDSLANIGTIQVVRDAENRKLLHSKGFGFLVFRNAEFKIRGEGYEYCSRLMIFDPMTGIAVDSHLPVADSDIPKFKKDLTEFKKHLETLGVNIAKAKVHLIFGNGDDDLVSGFPGPKIAEELKNQGFKLTSIQPARGGDVQYDFNLKTGKVSKVKQ